MIIPSVMDDVSSASLEWADALLLSADSLSLSSSPSSAAELTFDKHNDFKVNILDHGTNQIKFMITPHHAAITWIRRTGQQLLVQLCFDSLGEGVIPDVVHDPVVLAFLAHHKHAGCM